MAQISAKATKFIYNDHEDTRVTFNVGNCKLNEKDIKTLLDLQRISKEHPYSVIDCRN